MASARVSTVPDTPPSLPAGRRFPALGGCQPAILDGALGFVCTRTALPLDARGEFVRRLGRPTELRAWLVRGEELGGEGRSRGQVVGRRDAVVSVRTAVGFWAWRGVAPAPDSPPCDGFERQASALTAVGACP
jgi:hypothetical protein